MTDDTFEKTGTSRVSSQVHGDKEYAQLNLTSPLTKANLQIGDEVDVLVRDGEVLIRRVDE